MKKVSELTGAELDHWVAKAEGVTGKVQNGYPNFELLDYRPSLYWNHGGGIIEREGIKLRDGIFQKWKADLKNPYYKFSMEGPTALIAAMRAFVASRFGLEVDDSQTGG